MIARKTFLAAIGLGLGLGIRLPAGAREAIPAGGKPARIGLLLAPDRPQPLDVVRQDQLRTALRQLGWVEGRNLAIEIRHAGNNPQRQRELAAELKALPVALIIASGTAMIQAARDGAPGLPVVMVNAGDPVGSGFVASLARPGGDLTGSSAAGEELLAKQLELISSMVPQARRVSVLMNRANPANDFFFAAMAARAAALGVRIERVEVAQADELEAAVARTRGGALVVLGDPMFAQHRLRGSS